MTEYEEKSLDALRAILARLDKLAQDVDWLRDRIERLDEIQRTARDMANRQF